MVRRLLLVPVLCGLTLLSASVTTFAQTRPAPRPSAQDKAAGEPQPAARPAGKPAAQTPAQAVDPKLDKALEEWYESSKSITRLEGKHQRYLYDYQWSVSKRAEGEFYYESPDKGRIDLTPSTIKANEKKFTKTSPITGKQVTFDVEADAPERWICDGKKVLEIDDQNKQVTTYEIPKQAQGANIMDGPLPFLFGMEPEKAKQRYVLQLVQASEARYVIQVFPKWQQDAANYKWATVILERKTMLPEAVQMIDPAETTETVYTFPRVEKNAKKGGVLAFLRQNEDPFKPNLKGYKVIDPSKEEAKPVAAQGTGKTRPKLGDKDEAPVVPSIIGLSHEDAKKVLEARGYKVKFHKGKPATAPQQTFHAYEQTPKPYQELAQGEVVNVQLFVEPSIQPAKAVNKPEGAAKTGAVPNVRGLPFKEAEKRLVAAGYEVKFVRGHIATNPEDVYTVETQSPAAGQKIAEGEVITLSLLIADEKAKK